MSSRVVSPLLYRLSYLATLKQTVSRYGFLTCAILAQRETHWNTGQLAGRTFKNERGLRGRLPVLAKFEPVMNYVLPHSSVSFLLPFDRLRVNGRWVIEYAAEGCFCPSIVRANGGLISFPHLRPCPPSALHRLGTNPIASSIKLAPRFALRPFVRIRAQANGKLSVVTWRNIGKCGVLHALETRRLKICCRNLVQTSYNSAF
jgi:hypothetical protein